VSDQKILELALEGPMASWTNNQRQEYRLTQQFPTQSGIIGFLACALGRDRSADNRDLQSLQIEIVSATYGAIEVDFQTVAGASYVKNPYTVFSQSFHTITRTKTFYVQFVTDAKYRVSVQGEASLIDEIAWAMKHPHWQLYLGRRANTLSRPPFVSLRNVS